MKKNTKCPLRKSLRRILLYRGSLLRLQALGVNRFYSYTLGKETGVSAEQVRKDFSEYRIKGNQRGGYHVDQLISEMEHIFYKKGSQNIIVVGRGNIGSSLANYSNFIQRQINIVATFDIDPSKQRIRSEIPVYTMERLKEIIDRFAVRTAIVAVPEPAAQSVCDQLVEYGVGGIINFAPVILKVPDEVIINNINLSDEIESVIYCVSQACPEES
ncbi:MAG: redox-sensing transcriptional repressor Rex [Bacteroidales bacterium]|nr:redox-sensing transcriptional repressor Rex [Bacteroidales bacterium]